MPNILKMPNIVDKANRVREMPFLDHLEELRWRLLWSLLALALGAGVALTFLLDYLDDSVRNKSELEAMGVIVLAEVPKK